MRETKIFNRDNNTREIKNPDEQHNVGVTFQEVDEALKALRVKSGLGKKDFIMNCYG